MAWSRELSSSAFAAAPVIADIDADNQLDVAVASFTGDIHVVRGGDSENMRGSHWPFRLSDATVHSSPLQVLHLSTSRHSLLRDLRCNNVS